MLMAQVQSDYPSWALLPNSGGLAKPPEDEVGNYRPPYIFVLRCETPDLFVRLDGAK